MPLSRPSGVVLVVKLLRVAALVVILLIQAYAVSPQLKRLVNPAAPKDTKAEMQLNTTSRVAASLSGWHLAIGIIVILLGVALSQLLGSKEGRVLDWQGFLNGAKHLPLWAFALRASLLYFALIAATRWMGHRQVGILAGHNYLVAAGIVSLAAVRMVNPESSFIAALVIILVYAAVNVLQSYLDLKWPWAIDRQPVVLVQNGVLNKKNLLGSHVTLENLMGQLRLKGAHNLSEVNYAVLEPTGKISIIKKARHLPVNRQQMQLPPKTVLLPTVLVYNGKVQEEALRGLGLDRRWLSQKLGEKGLAQAEDVFLAALEADGTLYLSV